MSQAHDSLTTFSFDPEDRAALKEHGFGFDCSEDGAEFATLKGNVTVDIVPSKLGQDFGLNVVLPGGILVCAHVPRSSFIFRREAAE